MRIAVYGASGFTGGLTVAEALRLGVTPILVGRDEQRLRGAAKTAATAAAVAADRPGSAAGPGGGVTGAGAEIRVVGLDDPGELAAAFRDCDAMINCAGPFTLWGEPVVRAAIAAGVHYLDTAGEPRYLRRILDTFDADARAAGVSVVPGMADDGGPGDLIASLTARRLPSTVRLVVADLREPGVASRGTARSMVAVLAEDPTGYVDGDPPPGDGASAAGAGTGGTGGTAQGGPCTLMLPDGRGKVEVREFPLPGGVTIPRHVGVAAVRSVIRSDVAALFASLSGEYAESVPEIPEEQARRGARWLMLTEATDADGRRARGWVSGLDAYGSTAVIAVEGVRRLAAGGAPTGALAPAQAFDPVDFLDALSPTGVTWQVIGPED